MNGWLDDLPYLLLKIRLEGCYPLGVLVLVEQSGYGWQRHLAVAHYRHVGLHVLVNLYIVYVEMYYLSLLSVCVETTSNTVAETHTYGYNNICLLGHYVRRIAAVHSKHSDVERMVGRQSRQA